MYDIIIVETSSLHSAVAKGGFRSQKFKLHLALTLLEICGPSGEIGTIVQKKKKYKSKTFSYKIKTFMSVNNSPTSGGGGGVVIPYKRKFREQP